MFKINVETALLEIRNILRLNLTDLYSTAGGTRGTGNNFIFYDEPLGQPKYPVIEIKKVTNPTTPISLQNGTSNYWEFEQVVANIWISSKNGFKATIGGTEYKNSRIIQYYQSLIKTTLKSQMNTLHTAGILGYKHLDTSSIEYDPNTQLYVGNVTIRVMWFTA